MTSRNNLERRQWEESPAGKIELKARKIFNKREVQKKITEEDVRWLDINAATTMSKDRDLIQQFEKKEKELIDNLKEEYRQEFEKVMIKQFNERLDYLIKIEQRG